MVTEGFVFFLINEKTEASDIKKYIEMGFKVTFLRAGDFKKFKKIIRILSRIYFPEGKIINRL